MEENHDNQIAELRRLFLDKLALEKSEDIFSPIDIDRVKNTNIWLLRFLEQNDFIMKDTIDQLWKTCEWRKKKGINEISPATLRMEYVHDSRFFPHGRDLDGKMIIIFKSKLHIRGSRPVEDLKNILIYWVERLNRESNFDQITCFFDMENTGMSNMDMDFTKFIIDTFKLYYPNTLNYILVYELPWILTATFKIIKSLLPAKAVAKMKFINKTTIREYISEDNMLTCWGGTDDYTFKFVEEETIPVKKVHFADTSMSSQQESPMSENPSSNFPDKNEGMLKIVPQNTVILTKTDTDTSGFIEITNVSNTVITYKVKTTSPDKYRVRPSNGIINVGSSARVNISLQSGFQITSIVRDKFLVMAMPFDDMDPNTDIAELWKNTLANSPKTEQYRLRCISPVNLMDEDNVKVFNYSKYDSEPSNRNFGPPQVTLAQLADTTRNLERRVKHTQTLQWITLFIFLMLAIAIVFIMKMEIRNSINEAACTSK